MGLLSGPDQRNTNLNFFFFLRIAQGQSRDGINPARALPPP
jgi:hypothetical protein